MFTEIIIDIWDFWDCDSWDCWYCVLSVLATVCPVGASFLSVLSISTTVLCPTDVSLPPFFPSVDIFNDQPINRLIGEYWCLGFEIDTTCPRHCWFVSFDRAFTSALIYRPVNQRMRKLTFILPINATSIKTRLRLPAFLFRSQSVINGMTISVRDASVVN